jgi:uncharacterized membrane protein YdjX (TVP38/TMEM64 family)
MERERERECENEEEGSLAVASLSTIKLKHCWWDILIIIIPYIIHYTLYTNVVMKLIVVRLKKL